MATPTTLEQITGFTAQRTAKAARMDDLMKAAGAEGVTLDETQSAEYDGLADELERLDKHLARLAVLERTNRAQAVPVQGSSRETAAESRAAEPGTGRIYLRDNLPPGIEFARALICKVVSFKNQYSISPLDIAKQRYPDQPRIQQTLKAAVAAGTTTDATWAGPLVDPTNLASEFLAWLRPQTILGQFGTGGVPSLRAVPFNVRIAGQTSGGLGFWVGQGKAKPLTKFDYQAVTLGFSKVAAISVITEELARFSSPSAEALVRDGLRDALVERLDIDFIDPAKAEVAAVSPASITNGVTPLTSSGTTADDIREDLKALMGAFVGTNMNVADLVLITTNGVALSLSMMMNTLGQREFPGITISGGSLNGIPVVASQYADVTGGEMLIAANAKAIALADDGAVSVEASREASLEMSDAPTGASAPATATSLVSMWQTNSIALKAERFINWKKLRTGAVAWMYVSWSGSSGS